MQSRKKDIRKLKAVTMLNKDKLIIVAYINMGLISDTDASEFLAETARALKPNGDDSILFYVIPVREGETRLDCINPKLVSEEEYEKARQACEKITEKLAELEKDES